MEHELFTWTGWDGDEECMIFYSPVLVIPIDEFPVGTKFDGASITQYKYSYGVLQFFNKDKNGILKLVAQFSLHYKIGGRIN